MRARDRVRAQSILEGKVTGTVKSEDGAALPGATVEIAGPSLIAGARSTTTSARGTYVFLNLPVGKYHITVSRDAFKTIVQENIDVSAAAVATVDLTLPVGTMEERVTVTRRGPHRRHQDLHHRREDRPGAAGQDPDEPGCVLRPGADHARHVRGSGAPTGSTEFQSPTAYCSATNENVFLINGVNTTNPRAGSFGSLVNVNYDTVEEVRIVALGSKAEYGSYSGAAIDVLTKSGSNDFHGSAAYYSQAGLGGQQPARPRRQISGRRGCSWARESSSRARPRRTGRAAPRSGVRSSRTGSGSSAPSTTSAARSLPPRWPLESESWGRYADAKISAAPFKNHHAWVAYHYENNDGNGWSWGIGAGVGHHDDLRHQQTNNTVSAQWQWFAERQDDRAAKFLGFWTKDKPYIPEDHPDHPGYINWWKWADLRSYGINGAFPYVEG